MGLSEMSGFGPSGQAFEFSPRSVTGCGPPPEGSDIGEDGSPHWNLSLEGPTAEGCLPKPPPAAGTTGVTSPCPTLSAGNDA